MPQKHDVIHDIWQINMFVTLQICQNLSNFSYMLGDFSSRIPHEDLDAETEEVEQAEQPRRLSA